MNDLTSEQHFTHAVNIAVETVKSLLLLNGGAATALIALNTAGDADFSFPVLLFGSAALLDALALAIGYFSQLNYANARLANERKNIDAAETSMKLHRKFQRIAVSTILVSLVFSTAGMTMAYIAI